MESLRTKMEEHLTCAICLEQLKDPKVLPCLHFYCHECIVKLNKTGINITCPECRMPVEVRDLHKLQKFQFFMLKRLCILCITFYFQTKPILFLPHIYLISFAVFNNNIYILKLDLQLNPDLCTLYSQALLEFLHKLSRNANIIFNIPNTYLTGIIHRHAQETFKWLLKINWWAVESYRLPLLVIECKMP